MRRGCCSCRRGGRSSIALKNEHEVMGIVVVLFWLHDSIALTTSTSNLYCMSRSLLGNRGRGKNVSVYVRHVKALNRSSFPCPTIHRRCPIRRATSNETTGSSASQTATAIQVVHDTRRTTCKHDLLQDTTHNHAVATPAQRNQSHGHHDPITCHHLHRTLLMPPHAPAQDPLPLAKCCARL